jgi:hypothetical protein
MSSFNPLIIIRCETPVGKSKIKNAKLAWLYMWYKLHYNCLILAGQNKDFLSIDSKMMEEDDSQEPKYSSQNAHMQANGNILAAACNRRGNS